jgi:prephenate dehydratase
VRLQEIQKVISHPQALAQCEHYLRSLKGVTVEPFYDTAGSVKAVSEMQNRDVAAIASKRAAEAYGLHILQEGIEDNQANFTRFLVLSIDSVSDPGEDAKTSIVFTLANQPGSLFKAMSVFALRDIDLTKIESRPLVGKPWEYLFYIDFLGSTTNLTITRALDHLREYSINLRVLGSYPRHRL